MITTTRGDMDETLLEKKTGIVDNDNEHTTWVEYWLKSEYEAALRQWQAEHPDGEVSNGGQMVGYVHRSVNMTLKKPVLAFGEAAKLGE